MKKTDCNIVKDLLPLYIDDVCSTESKEIVEKHLKQCKECTAEKAKMTGEIDLPKDTGLKALMNIKITISKKAKRRFVVFGLLLLAVIITVATVTYLLNKDIPVAYEDLDDDLQVFNQIDDLPLAFPMNDYYGISIYGAPQGDNVYILYYCYTTTPLKEIKKEIFYMMTDNPNMSYYGPRPDYIHNSGIGQKVDPNERIIAVYYLPMGDSGELPDTSDAVLMWSEE